ncbi:UNVERIFIED_CONTAM: putative NADH dehydrogenase [ubiquinone] 1 alpha subcomplex subunit 5, partial [Eudyptes robustus]
YPKKSTGLTGLWVNEQPHRTLTVIYGRILRTLENIPTNSPYRQNTEALVKHRLKLVEEEPDVFKLEEKIGMGQIEEVIQQAEYEVRTARAIVESKAWEPLVEPASEAQWRWPI